MIPDCNYFEIETADIWSYERMLFIDGKSSNEHAQKILDLIQASII